MPKITGTCDDCRFAQATAVEAYVECRRHSPAATVAMMPLDVARQLITQQPTVVCGFPVMALNGWCGDYEIGAPRELPPAPAPKTLLTFPKPEIIRP